MSDKSSEKLKDWLNKLQQESWQLELILTGFAIFLILGLKEPIDELMQGALKISISSTKFSFTILSAYILKLVWFFIITNLVIHLFLRSLWIGTIGLRYVSEDIELEHLNLAPVFERFLQKKVKKFDHYIETLEKLCSTIFAFTFLIIFVIISCAIYFLVIQLLDHFVFEQIRNYLGKVGNIISRIIRITLAIGVLLYFIDFVTLGWLKSLKKFSKFYFPFYRLFGWITLAALYRPLYYNLIDNRFGRWVGLLIVPYILVAVTASSAKLQYGKYFPREDTSYHLTQEHYDDIADYSILSQQTLFSPSIPTKYVDNDFLEVFFPYLGVLDNQAIETICPDIVPAKRDKIVFRGAINMDLADSLNYNIDTIMSCFQQIFRLSINDSTYTKIDWMIYDHPSRKLSGLLAVIDIKHLKRGRHQLKAERFGQNIFDPRNSTKTMWLKPEFIAFWKTSDQASINALPPSDSR